mgnify:CR=1 FL=1
MYNKRSFLAVIPARKGSKRLPGKNTRMLAGKAHIQRTIEAAQDSKYIDTIVVSSDDDFVLSLASKQSVETIRRPEVLANDTAGSADVLLHVVDNVTKSFDYVILLQPTSPLRTAEDIDNAIELLIEKKASSVISVCEAEHSPLWANTLPADRSLKGFIRDDIVGKRSQDLDRYYRLNGAIYIVERQAFINEKEFLFDDSYAYEMNTSTSVDIDTEYDFVCAEALVTYHSN